MSQLLATNVTKNLPSVVYSRFFSFRLPTVHLPLMQIHVVFAGEGLVAEFTQKHPFFVRLDPTFVCIASGRVVTLVVHAQFLNAVMVTLADLTHDVTAT